MSCQGESTATDHLANIRKLPVRYLKQVEEVLELDEQTLGAKIREARDLRGWKQKHLAEAVHVEPVTVSRWERDWHVPDRDKLNLIAEALQKPISYFVDEPDPGDEDKFALILEALREQATAEEKRHGGLEAQLREVWKLVNEIRDQRSPGESHQAQDGPA